jgi:hypothetical protein
MKKLFFLVAMLATSTIHAQTPVLADDVILTPSFFITILAGVILALTFQFILTAISVAAGITAIGDVRKSYVKSKVEPSNSASHEDYEFDQDYSSDTATGVKITTAFGIWSLITTCIALFGATALALNLNMVESSYINITTSLVIWGLFFLILFYLEAKMASTLIGNLISTATSGLKASASAVSSLFAPSPEKKIENVVENTINTIRSEFESGQYTDKLADVLDNFMTRVDNKIPDYEDLKNDLEGIAKKAQNKNTSAKWMAIQQILTKFISENTKSADPDKQSKAKKLQETLNTINEKYKEGGKGIEGAKNVVEAITPADRDEIDRRIEQIKELLSSSVASDFSSDKIRQAIKGLVNHPQMTASILADQVKALDKESIIEMLSSNTNLKKEDLANYSDQISAVIQDISKEFDSENENRLVKRIEAQVANFFNSTERQELNYNLLKNDVRRILDNPKDSISVIKNRLSTFDIDTLRAVVTNNRYVNDEHIDRIVETIANSKNEVLDKISQIESKAAQQIETVKRKAVIQAEHARATAASAAWWLVLTAILSAVAAMGGSMLPL